ncbi:PREDICTED: probable serine/threonine-protein kinase clkA [Polistes canadensis]|uniref:probable serine/threonine-protein kinase clkA n=1 Tax=Polistes canadensis TaxID=91411 RepID=UPI000718DA89|nr:PREDICTED: probable serine/threonine-protein kinase clkA [Polistes canadensis]
MPHCTTNFAWYLGKFIIGFTGMLILYMSFLKNKESTYPCKPEMRELLTGKKSEKRPGRCECEEAMQAKKHGCTCKERIGKCIWKERSCPMKIASKRLVKNNNAVNTRARKSFCCKKQGKFPDLINDKIYSCKCRWYNLINGTCIKRKSNKIKKQTCLRVSEDVVTDLWNMQKVCDIIKSQNNRKESVNNEKLIQEETTSSSYIDAKNCFVQDAYTQFVCGNEEKESCLKRNECRNKEIDDDTDKETKKYEETTLNCNCEHTTNIDVETLTCLKEENKSNTAATYNVTNNNNNNDDDDDLPYVPELELGEEDDCHPTACNCEYTFSEEHFGGHSIEKNEIEISRNYDSIRNKFKQNPILNIRNKNYLNVRMNNPSYRESNKYVYNELRTSTSTESLIYPESKMKVTRSNDRGYLMLIKHSKRINRDSRRRNDYSVPSFFRKINIKEDYSDRYLCRCQHFNEGTERKLIIEDKFEDTETNRSRSSFSSTTSLSSYDQDKSSRSYFDDNNYKCRNLSTFRSSTSSCTCNLSSEMEYQRSVRFNPLSSTITYTNNYNNNNNNSYNKYILSKDIIYHAKKITKS